MILEIDNQPAATQILYCIAQQRGNKEDRSYKTGGW